MDEKEVKNNENFGFTELWMEQRKKRNKRKFYVVLAGVLPIIVIAFVLVSRRGTEMLCEHQDRECVQQYSDALINLVEAYKKLGKCILTGKDPVSFFNDRLDLLDAQAQSVQSMISVVKRFPKEDVPKEVKNFLLSLH